MPVVRRVPARESPQPIEFLPPAASRDSSGDVVAIDAPRYTRALGGRALQWRVIPNLGSAAGAVAAFPQGRSPTTQQDS
ncbi:hypothetical protein, partial [Streptomyces europaeiscabiei]|uniref:hypothetical protein n=1 Tax=Streptomyces europaeiscabiei TaxID=146819 RepID=UPI0038F7A562